MCEHWTAQCCWSFFIFPWDVQKRPTPMTAPVSFSHSIMSQNNTHLSIYDPWKCWKALDLGWLGNICRHSLNTYLHFRDYLKVLCFPFIYSFEFTKLRHERTTSSGIKAFSMLVCTTMNTKVDEFWIINQDEPVFAFVLFSYRHMNRLLANFWGAIGHYWVLRCRMDVERNLGFTLRML